MLIMKNDTLSNINQVIIMSLFFAILSIPINTTHTINIKTDKKKFSNNIMISPITFSLQVNFSKYKKIEQYGLPSENLYKIIITTLIFSWQLKKVI